MKQNSKLASPFDGLPRVNKAHSFREWPFLELCRRYSSRPVLFAEKNRVERMQKAPDLAIWNPTRGGRFCSEETKPGGLSQTGARLRAGAAGDKDTTRGGRASYD